jgi:hypothetical protein
MLSPGGTRAGGCSALALGAGIQAGVGIARDASRDPRAAGRAAAAQALADVDPAPGHTVLLLFVDPRSGDEADAIDGAYAVAGGGIPLAGGGADGAAPNLIADDVCADDAVVAVAISSCAPVGVGIADGCRPRPLPAVATRTEHRVIRELDGRRADEVYLESLGVPATDVDDDGFEALAVLHPLAQPELRGQMRLRHVIGRTPEGGLACATAIPPNAAVWFTDQDTATIVKSAEHAVHDAIGPLRERPAAALVFDCAARKRALGGRLGDEAAAIVSAFGEAPALAGLYTRGEVGRIRGAKGDRNHAIVVVAF